MSRSEDAKAVLCWGPGMLDKVSMLVVFRGKCELVSLCELIFTLKL